MMRMSTSFGRSCFSGYLELTSTCRHANFLPAPSIKLGTTGTRSTVV